MLKKNKGFIILTTIVAALPILMGLLLWNQLPDQVATHFNINGVADSWSSKEFAVFALPLFLVGVHLICVCATMADPRRQNIPNKIFRLLLWICPVLSVITNGCIYLIAIGIDVNIGVIIQLMIGLLFIVLGNYMPKCRQNYTMGIKLPWTLADEDNWNQTHRMAGWLWIAAGILLIVLTILNWMQLWFMIALIALMILVPTAYSFLYYLKHQNK